MLGQLSKECECMYYNVGRFRYKTTRNGRIRDASHRIEAKKCEGMLTVGWVLFCEAIDVSANGLNDSQYDYSIFAPNKHRTGSSPCTRR